MSYSHPLGVFALHWTAFYNHVSLSVFINPEGMVGL